MRIPYRCWCDVCVKAGGRRIQRARLKQIQYIQSKHVHRNVLRADAKRRGIPILRTRWVDTDDDHEHNYRSSFVAMEINTQTMNG